MQWSDLLINDSLLKEIDVRSRKVCYFLIRPVFTYKKKKESVCYFIFFSFLLNHISGTIYIPPFSVYKVLNENDTPPLPPPLHPMKPKKKEKRKKEKKKKKSEF
jgi:hypothetical protein